MAGNLAIVLFDGLAFGMLLFVLSVGLSVTLGLMGFINLAHGAFAMLGGYVAATAMRTLGLPFLAALPLAFLAAALLSIVFEHGEGAVGEVDEAHQPKRDRQPDRQDEEQHPEGEAVEKDDGEVAGHAAAVSSRRAAGPLRLEFGG